MSTEKCSSFVAGRAGACKTRSVKENQNFFLILNLCAQPTHSDALAVLADVAGSAREEMEVAGQLQVHLPGLAQQQTAFFCGACEKLPEISSEESRIAQRSTAPFCDLQYYAVAAYMSMSILRPDESVTAATADCYWKWQADRCDQAHRCV